MAETLTLINAKKGQLVVLPSGKRIISDGQGGGKRAPAEPVAPTTPAAPSTTPVVKKKKAKKKVVSTQPAAKTPPPPTNGNTVARGLRRLAGQGNELTDLVRQTKGK